ncbi:MAG: hypothetical protein U0168_06980 [Nannocystaceae bacterium]
MDPLLVARWFHLLAAATWTGGLVVLAASVVVLRRAGADRTLLQAVARGFARLSWTAMAIAVSTGLLQVVWMQLPWSYGRLHTKLGAVALVIVLALVHQLTARRSSPRARGILQGLILVASLAVFAAAVAL